MTVKHAVARVIPNLSLLSENNDAYSEPARKIQHMLVLLTTVILTTYTKQLPLTTNGDLKRCFEEKVYVNLTSFSVEIALKI